jgi:hypothetical protein
MAKVLAADSDAVHVRLYKEAYPIRPEEVDPARLTLGSFGDAGGYGMGHVPLSHDMFRSWEPILVRTEPVLSEELDGFNYWLESQGGAFG